MGRWTVYAACGASLALGLWFIFVWAPHPWGWEGFDHYHDLGRVLSRGESFPTTDVPWGYAYYLAAFYRAFGDRPWIPLVVQAALNAILPLFVYLFARDEFDERIAVGAAALTGLFSFNTVYASTQSSDAICTVLFMAAIVVFARARRRGRWRLYALAGALLGIAPQFRPNLILVPFVLAAFLVLERRTIVRVVQGGILVVAASLMLTPWIARNYRLAGEFIPTSTHGGVQLWYGTLQTGPYLKSRAYNPRSVFETASFPYTSLDRVPLIVTGRVAPCASRVPPTLVYWTDRDQRTVRVATTPLERGAFTASMAPSPAPTTYYYSFEGMEPSRAGTPHVFFISRDHLADLDRHGDLLDAFDIARLLAHIAWGAPVPDVNRIDLNGDGGVSYADLERAVQALLTGTNSEGHRVDRIDREPDRVVLRFDDGATFAVPRGWTGRVTDLEVSGLAALNLLRSTMSLAALRVSKASDQNRCAAIENVEVNAVYYRQEPHMMRRYLALAADNIERDPKAYLAGVAYRAVRVFFIEGSDDPQTVQQFSGSGRVYALAHAGSIGLFVLAVIGMVVAWRRKYAIALPLVLIAYIPATLAFVLTNMRYSVTVQPLLFIFVATALLSALETIGAVPPPAPAGDPGTPRLEDARTGRQP